MKKLNQYGFSIVEGALILLIVAIIGGVTYYVFDMRDESGSSSVSSEQNKVNNEPVTRAEPNLQKISDYEKENCKVVYPKSITEPFNEDNFSISLPTQNAAIITCHTDNEMRYSLRDGTLDVFVWFTAKEYLTDFSGAPAKEIWSADLKKSDSSYELSNIAKNKDNLASCNKNPEGQVCGDDYSINVSVKHPRLMDIQIGLRDEGVGDSPRLDLYDKIIESIRLPE